MKRVLAMLVLPASILPVFLTGPSLLRAPERLWRQLSAEVQPAHRSTTAQSRPRGLER